MSKYVKIFKGNAYTKSSPLYAKSVQKIITFDLDETLGSFGDLYILWKGIHTYIEPKIENTYIFRELIELYPEFIRHGILNILDFLYHKKLAGKCSKIFLYTNNKCNEEWSDLITRYLSENVGAGTELFDSIICAFKINNKQIQPSRTTNNKTYTDLIRCTLLPKTAEICFIDNTYYDKMLNERVYYIQPKSYIHNLSTDEIIERFISKWSLFTLPDAFESTLYEWFLMNGGIRKTNPMDIDISIDLSVSQKIMYYLKEYFLLSTKSQKTKKIALSLGRFTRKKRL